MDYLIAFDILITITKIIYILIRESALYTVIPNKCIFLIHVADSSGCVILNILKLRARARRCYHLSNQTWISICV